jgi:hypothetical protein
MSNHECVCWGCGCTIDLPFERNPLLPIYCKNCFKPPDNYLDPGIEAAVFYGIVWEKGNYYTQGLGKHAYRVLYKKECSSVGTTKRWFEVEIKVDNGKWTSIDRLSKEYSEVMVLAMLDMVDDGIEADDTPNAALKDQIERLEGTATYFLDALWNELDFSGKHITESRKKLNDLLGWKPDEAKARNAELQGVKIYDPGPVHHHRTADNKKKSQPDHCESKNQSPNDHS